MLNLMVQRILTKEKKHVSGTRENLVQKIRDAFDVCGPIVMYQKDPSGDWVEVNAGTVRDASGLQIRLENEPKPDFREEEDLVSKDLKYREKLKEKLRNNEILTGKDREYLWKFLGDPERGKEDVKPVLPDHSPDHAKGVKRQRLDSDSSTETIPAVKKKTSNKATQTEDNLIVEAKPKDFSEVKNYMKKLVHQPPSKRKEEELDKCMNATFDDRRSSILKKSPAVKSIKESYPALFDKRQLLSEFSRITGKDVVQTFYQNLNSYSSAIIASTSKLGHLKSVIEKKAKAARAEERKYINCTGALYLLPSLLSEKISKAVQFESKQPSTDYPVILCESSLEDALEPSHNFKLFAENVHVVDSEDFLEAMLLLISIFYCFNMEYPDSFSQTAMLLEILLLQMEPEQELPRLVEKARKKILSNS